LFFSGSFIRCSHVCIIPVFLNIPALAAQEAEIRRITVQSQPGQIV
jgi:hypothetical protein